MKYIKVIVGIVVMIATFTVDGRELSLADMIQLNHLNSNYWEWLTSDSLLSQPIIKNFVINQKEDTIYIECFKDEIDRIGVNIWNNQNGIYIGKEDFKDSTFYIRETKIRQQNWDKRLLINWEIDSIRRINDGRVPPIQCFIHRIIINDRRLKIDTVEVFYPYSIKDYWINKRNIIHVQKNDRRKEDIDNTKEYNEIEAITPREPTRSLWQRIVDWFRGLWKAIFG